MSVGSKLDPKYDNAPHWPKDQLYPPSRERDPIIPERRRERTPSTPAYDSGVHVALVAGVESPVAESFASGIAESAPNLLVRTNRLAIDSSVQMQPRPGGSSEFVTCSTEDSHSFLQDREIDLAVIAPKLNIIIDQSNANNIDCENSAHSIRLMLEEFRHKFADDATILLFSPIRESSLPYNMGLGNLLIEESSLHESKTRQINLVTYNFDCRDGEIFKSSDFWDLAATLRDEEYIPSGTGIHLTPSFPGFRITPHEDY